MRISRYLFRDIVTFAGLLLGVVLFLAWWALARALDAQAWARAEEATARVTVELDRELRDVAREGEALRDWWRGGAYVLESPERLETLALAILSRQSFVSSVNFCRADGTSALLLRSGDAWQTRVLRPGAHGNEQRWTRRRGAHGPAVQEPWSATSYDPRTREWYRLVADGARDRWSPEAYRFMTTGDPGLTLSLPVVESGDFKGVVALDVMLDDLTHRVWAAQPTPGTRVVIADERGRALILPGGAPWQDREARYRDFLRPLPDLVPELAELLSDLETVPREGRRVWTRTERGAAYGLVVPYRGPSGLTWYLVVAIPADEIMGGSSVLGLAILAIAVLGFAFLAWRARAIAHRFGQPLDKLAGSARPVEASPASSHGAQGAEPVWEPVALQDALGLANRAVEEQQALREQLRSSQRREIVAQLASGVVHDVNNQLTVALAQIEGSVEVLGARHPVAAELDLARHALLRGGEINKALLSLARSAPSAMPRNLDVAELCRGVARLLGRVLGSKVELQLELEAGLPPVAGVPAQLEQALLNLALNARDAMPAGGTLTFRATRGPAGHVRLSVTDTGTGMSQEVTARVFEPYFTTKAAGQGTGLGLAMVYGIVRSHGGAVTVESVEGVGTTFTIDLPAAPGAASADSSASPSAPLDALKGKRLLVADDEPALLQALNERLSRAGAQVETAVDGADAAAKWRRCGPFHAVVSDLEMPKASGLELYGLVRAASPETAFLVVSGNALDGAEAALGPDPRAATLAKPYQTPELLEVLARLLGAG